MEPCTHVRFSGYDGALEAPFFVSEHALKQIQPDMPSDESGLLKAFDLNPRPHLRDA